MTELDNGDLSESDLTDMKPEVLPVLRLRHMGLSDDQDIVPYNNNIRFSGVSSFRRRFFISIAARMENGIFNSKDAGKH